MKHLLQQELWTWLKRSRFKSWFNVTCNVSLWFLKRDLIAFRHLVANPVSQILSRRVKVKRLLRSWWSIFSLICRFTWLKSITMPFSSSVSAQQYMVTMPLCPCRFWHLLSYVKCNWWAKAISMHLIYSTWYWEVFNSVCKFTRKRVIIKNCVGQLTYSQDCLGVLQTC